MKFSYLSLQSYIYLGFFWELDTKFYNSNFMRKKIKIIIIFYNLKSWISNSKKFTFSIIFFILAGSSKSHHIKLPADLPKAPVESPLPPVGIPSSMGGIPISTHHPLFENRMPPLDPLRKVRKFSVTRWHGCDIGSCLKTGQHLFFVIIYLLLPIKCIIFYSVSKILFKFFHCQ